MVLSDGWAANLYLYVPISTDGMSAILCSGHTALSGHHWSCLNKLIFPTHDLKSLHLLLALSAGALWIKILVSTFLHLQLIEAFSQCHFDAGMQLQILFRFVPQGARRS